MLVQQFLNNEKGNIALTFALCSTVIFSAVGVSVDYARLINIKNEAQNVLDASLLAAATEYQRTGNKRKAKLIGIEHMTSSLSHLDKDKLDIQVDNNFLSGSYDGEMDNTFLAIFSTASSSWAIKARIKLPKRSTTDFALAIDVSNTMVKNGLMPGLIKSLDQFSEQVFKHKKSGDVSVSVVPFANAVSFESHYIRWLDRKEGFSQTSTFNGCFEYEPIGTRNLLSTAGNSQRIAAFDRRKASKGENLPFCPDSDSNISFYLDNQSTLSLKTSNLSTGQGTNTADGLTWAWRALSTNWKNVFNESAIYPRADSANHNKVIILLTDGIPYALPSVDLGSKDKDDANKRAREEFLEACNQIIEAGNIDLYSIVYGNLMSKTQKADIHNCTARGGKTYWGGNADQLSEILINIVTSNNQLALSR